MATEIVMPAMEMAQDSAVLLRWLKSEGEFVRKGEPVMQIETDKVSVDIEAPASGILSHLAAQPGDDVAIGHVVALLLNEGDSPAPAPTRAVEISAARRNTVAVSAAREFVDSPVTPRLSAASPKARRLATEQGTSLSGIVGSGPHGAVLTTDVQITREKREAISPPSREEREFTSIPLKGSRKTIAQRVLASYQNAPHIALTLSVDMTETLRLLERLGPTIHSETGHALSITAVLAKFVAGALLQHPRLNAHLVEDEIREFSPVHLGIAVAREEGLIVPVIRDVEQKGLGAIQSELDDLAARAREGTLSSHEVRGSTFTLSNLGMFGIEQFTSILNPPEVGILSIGVFQEMPVGVKSEIVLRPMMQVTLNADHRVIDGAVGAAFLKTLKQALENPYLLLA